MPTIRAGSIQEACPESGDWAFADLGFANTTRSCGWLEGDNKAAVHTFAELKTILVTLAQAETGPLNLLLEAPLSVAFERTDVTATPVKTDDPATPGNPVGRRFERREGQKPRYWYLGLACGVMTAALYLLRALSDSRPRREVRLFEGFASFKPREVRSDHCEDVRCLRKIVWGKRRLGCILGPAELAEQPTHILQSAFAVAQMDYGVPPVVVVGGTRGRAVRTTHR